MRRSTRGATASLAEDESTGFVLPRAALLRLALALPASAGDVARCAGRVARGVARRAEEAAAVIRAAVADPAPAAELYRAWVRAAQLAREARATKAAAAAALVAPMLIEPLMLGGGGGGVLRPAAPVAPPAAPAPRPRLVKPLALGRGAQRPRALAPLGGLRRIRTYSNKIARPPHREAQF